MSDRPEPRWLPLAAVRAIHADQLRQHGGRRGLRDPGLLESALERARSRWLYDAAADLCDCAAAVGYGLVHDHPFIDGNKRVAFQAMYVFLGLNGYLVQAEETDVVRLMLALASGALSERELAEWLRGHGRLR